MKNEDSTSNSSDFYPKTMGWGVRAPLEKCKGALFRLENGENTTEGRGS